MVTRRHPSTARPLWYLKAIDRDRHALTKTVSHAETKSYSSWPIAFRDFHTMSVTTNLPQTSSDSTISRETHSNRISSRETTPLWRSAAALINNFNSLNA